MKALKSPLAKELLADPVAAGRLRHYLVTKSASQVSGADGGDEVFIEIPSKDGTRRVRPMVVPKAA